MSIVASPLSIAAKAAFAVRASAEDAVAASAFGLVSKLVSCAAFAVVILGACATSLVLPLLLLFVTAFHD